MRKIFLMAAVLLSHVAYTHAQLIDTLIAFENHQLHFQIIEGNDHPILFEAGNGDDGSVWQPLLTDIHKKTGATLITYDRAGLGKSSIDTSRITFQQEVLDLKIALEKLGYDDNFFLVAHSFGSFYASEFSKLKEDKIKGAVFIDVSTPCAFDVDYASKVKTSISTENWKLIKEYKPGLFYVLIHLPEIAQYMSDRFIASTIPVTVIAADLRVPTKEIGEDQQDMIDMTNCLKRFGSLPNNKYLLATETEHKVWIKKPALVIDEIVKAYHRMKKQNP